jgi:leucyl aminopeptidase
MKVERHRPRVIKLTYDGGGGPHYFFAGKGVTYDTGGADLKVGGSMAGMSMDKGGAAGVAGFFGLLAAAQPKGLRATAYLGCVRNSIGSEAYVSDEIMASRAGVKIVVGNTDAEGRMVLADMLAALRDEAAAAGDAVAMSVATLTGHVGRAYGPYAAVMANGAAVAADWPRRIQQAGELLGDPFEWSMIRREDYDMIRPKTKGGPIVQCNSAASVNTQRGHQFPFCFLEKVSGLEHHDVGAASPVPYLHLDIAFSVTHTGGSMDGLPSGSPVPALAGALLGW